MKRFLKILIVVVFVITSSCAPQKINIIGKPGTEIYSCDMQIIAEIPNSGSVVVPMNKDYIGPPMLLSLEKNSGRYIPFALDFEKNSNREIYLWTTWPTAPLLAYGPFFWLLVLEGWNRQEYYHFKYLPEQQTNQDIVFTPLKQTADYKTLDKSPQKVSQQKANTERRKFNSGTSQSNKDTMSVITGTYSGKGELLDGSEVIEKYDDLNVIVKKKDENTVSVSVLDFDGYSFFDEELIYSVTKQDNQYVLKQKGANSRIVIKNGILSYTNHSINDGDMIYTLKINANK